MQDTTFIRGWDRLPPGPVEPGDRLDHVRACSDFAASWLDRRPGWIEGIDQAGPPDPAGLQSVINEHGLKAGLRRFRNQVMLGIVWRDLCGLAPLGDTFRDLDALARLCLSRTLEAHGRRLEEKHGTPRGPQGEPQRAFVIALGKFGGGELNLSSDIDIIFCYPHGGECDGRKALTNDQFFNRQARAVIASLSELTEDGFCFRVDTRLRPFGNAGPLTSSLAALEQYYQREGRDWERYALIKARPVAGDLEAGRQFIENVRPFVYRRYIDYSAVEALQEMHANVQQDARRKDRLDDIKRGPGGIREIEFLAQCFQILRGGREPSLQTPSLHAALSEIGRLGLMDAAALDEIRSDYAYLRFLENRIQALRDQQTHRVPQGEDRERIAQAMGANDVPALDECLRIIRDRVGSHFQSIFPAQPARTPSGEWSEHWRALRHDRQNGESERPGAADQAGCRALDIFVQRLERVALSQRADQRLDRFMPGLLEQLDRAALEERSIDRVFDLVLAICRRSAYLVLLVQHPKALDRLVELFARSDWIADKVIRFPALLDELIDPALGVHIPNAGDFNVSVDRILDTAQDTEAVLEALNYLKLATELRIAVGQLQSGLPAESAQQVLSDLADALLRGVLAVAGREIQRRHGTFDDGEGHGTLAIIAYGTLGAGELAYGSDLDIVFLFETRTEQSNGERPLSPEQYHARMAQRILSFLTVMTPSGRLYEVDTRLRPNGRAGSLVSSMRAFSEYQQNEAWTWELQALTRARFVVGPPSLESAFQAIRQKTLCRKCDEATLADELREMRGKIAAEHASRSAEDARSVKHQPGGLVDIEFIAQLGILAGAASHPQLTAPTGTVGQVDALAATGWLDSGEAQTLRESLMRAQSVKLMAALVGESPDTPLDNAKAAGFFEARIGTVH
ncbi:MAG: bifunctional [glutamate--ammonia ligase]-adenylyl-L-tyrosine phosphorylase/[glutamate--ammonia-ligase] adenylyltransferase [Xanthomonadales bacterium]|nr:bifunctional [glutamate--ammonia ligase]-adenylyl-L-tyrosine phosphorylase/[glutamate--ammonia-ligase] adenylyltransferase [Xanthomonadales bacterium]